MLPPTRLSSLWFEVRSKETAEAFKTLMEASSEVTIHEIDVHNWPIGGEGWKVLAEGVRLPPRLRLWAVKGLKADLEEASQEDIRVLWDALKTDGRFTAGRIGARKESVWKREGEDGWSRLTE